MGSEMAELSMPSLRVSVSPGSAVVAREAEALLVADPQGPAQERFLDDVLNLMSRSPARAGGLVRAVAALVVQADPDDVPSFGLVLGMADHLVAMLAGEIRLQITWPNEIQEEFLGRDATTYVERAIRGPFVRILLTGPDHESVPDPRSNLSGGVVRGAGVLLTPGATASEEPDAETLADLAPVPPDAEPAEAQPVAEPVERPDPVAVPDSVDQVEPAEAEVPQPFEPISLFGSDDEPAASADQPDEEAGVMVQGIMCSRGHFNDPHARFCSRCGISMVHQTHHMVTGIRPPLGVVVTDDGSVFALVSDYVLGREPGNAPDAMSGDAVPIPLEDPGLLMSRVHARIRLDGWSVQVEDAASANGTFVADSMDSEWTPLDPGVPRNIRPGARIRLGGRTLTFESHQRS